jgi:hypothetical protein
MPTDTVPNGVATASTPAAAAQATARMAGDSSLASHLRTCSAPRSVASQARQALEWLHGVTAPRLVSTWFAVLLLATLLALAF